MSNNKLKVDLTQTNYNGIDHSSVKKHATKGAIMHALWRVYFVLMEYCHPLDYNS